MKLITQIGVTLIVVLSLLASCGGGGGGAAAPSCTPNGNIFLHSSSTGTTPLLSSTVTATQGAAVPPFPVFVAYTTPPVAAILAGYPPGSADPRTFGIDIAAVSTANPAEFSLTFNSTGAIGTYEATWRFVVTDAGANVLGCEDLPVTFTII